MPWVNGSAIVFGKPISNHVKNRRLALLKRRHRVWLRRQLADLAPTEDEAAGVLEDD